MLIQVMKNCHCIRVILLIIAASAIFCWSRIFLNDHARLFLYIWTQIHSYIMFSWTKDFFLPSHTWQSCQVLYMFSSKQNHMQQFCLYFFQFFLQAFILHQHCFFLGYQLFCVFLARCNNISQQPFFTVAVVQYALGTCVSLSMLPSSYPVTFLHET